MKPICSAAPLAAVDATARLSSAYHAREQLLRGGATQRAARATRRMRRRAAARVGSKTGKGHVGELDQASSFTFRAGALKRPAVAVVNERANDPINDLYVLHERGATGWQVKTTQKLRPAEARKYERIVTSAPVPPSMTGSSPLVTDRLRLGEHEARRLDAADMEHVAALAIEKELAHEPPLKWIDIFVAAFRAGGIDAVAAAGLSLAKDAAAAWWQCRPFDWTNASRDAIVHAVRTGTRTFLQTLLLAKHYFERAGRKFEAGLAHAVGSLAVLFGAIAEVIVEVVADLVELIRGNLTLEQLCKRALIHMCTASAAAFASIVAAAVTPNAPWWLQMAALVLAATLGGYGGRMLGEELTGTAISKSSNRLVGAAAQ